MATSSLNSRPRRNAGAARRTTATSSLVKIQRGKRSGSPDNLKTARKRQRGTNTGTETVLETKQPHSEQTADAAYSWLNKPIDQEQASVKWQRQYGIRSHAKKLQAYQEYRGDDVVAHHDAVVIEDTGMVRLGDFVELFSGEQDKDGTDRPWIMRVDELFEDVHGGKFLSGHWFYSLWNTALLVEKTGDDGLKTKEDPVQLSPKHIFKASDHDNQDWNQGQDGPFGNIQSLQAISKRVNVVHVHPGQPEPEDCDYWWSQEHDRRFFTFIDKYPEGSQPDFVNHLSAGHRELKALHLYCGAGGMSFVGGHHTPSRLHTHGDSPDSHDDQQAANNGSVHISTCWGVDVAEAMCNTFKVNHPEAKVWNMGVDEAMVLCKKFKALSDAFPDDWGLSDEDDDDEEEEEDITNEESCSEDRSDYTGSSRTSTGKEWEVEEIYNVRVGDEADRKAKGKDAGELLQPLTEDNSWLEFQVKWKGWSSKSCPDGTTWVPQGDLCCDRLLARFVQDLRRRRIVPLPGDVDVVMGGPPCQGVSGNNRHAAQVNILDDSRNRQVTAFYNVVSWFKPGFVLMENVVDILHKEDGIYAKSAMGSLLQMGYQARMGIIAAYDQGAPQARNRVFMWGAKSGEEQLPPFPEPSHNAEKTKSGHKLPLYVKDLCVVQFQTATAENKAPPVPVIGDILSDLPEISSFTMTENADYKTEPQTPYQHFLRRSPPDHEESQDKRAEAADKFMKSSHDAKRMNIYKALHADDGVQKVGALFSCSRLRQGPTESGALWNRVLHNCSSTEAGRLQAATRRAGIAAATRALHYHIGIEVKKSLEAARAVSRPSPPLRDHISCCHNLDDHLRICLIPKRKGANFRDWPGVTTWPNRTCCAGHSHALMTNQGTSCPGGGNKRKSQVAHTRHEAFLDHSEWTGTELDGCPSWTAFLPTGAVVCPGFCTTLREGKSSGATASYGRLWYDEIRNTVTGRAEPHSQALLHPGQDRVVSIRESARMQGFPDYYALVGLGPTKAFSRNATIIDRYQQMGNAVSPCVASALGRCLALAAVGAVPADLDHAVVPVPDPQLIKSMQESRAKGLQTWTEQQAAAKQAAMQVTDPDQAGTNDWLHLDCAPPSLHSIQVEPESSPKSGDLSLVICTADAQLENDCADGSQPEDVRANESQPEGYCASDSQPEHDWACLNNSQVKSAWADESRREDDYASALQPEDRRSDNLQQKDSYSNNVPSEGECADGEEGLAPQNWPGSEEAEQPWPLDTIPDCGQWEEDVQSDLCLNLSSDEEG